MKNKLKQFIDGELSPKVKTSHRNKEKTKLNHIYVTKRTSNSMYIGASIAVTIVFILALLYMVTNLPTFGSENNPAINEVVERYVEDGMYETGATNLVAGMILDYRAFDTFGEANVLFLAVICVIILLKKDSVNISLKDEEELIEDEEILLDAGNSMIKVLTKILFPIILLFGIYVIINGHLSPGGGFSGGAIIGAALIMYSTAYGFEKTSKFLNFKVFTLINVCCLLTYFVLKSYSFFTGANHVGFSVPKGVPGDILSAGFILPLNICVGLIVACTMYGFYALFTRGDL